MSSDASAAGAARGPYGTAAADSTAAGRPGAPGSIPDAAAGRPGTPGSIPDARPATRMPPRRRARPCWPSVPASAEHDVAVVLGSGWAPAADALGPARAEVPLAELGGFAPPTVAGHSPVVRSVTAGGLRVLVFLGRTHLYEGHPVPTVVHGVRTAAAAGCRVVVLTNAAGGIRAGYQVGQPVLISDHLNLTACSPLAGDPPPAGYPPRFADLTDLYSARLRALARAPIPAWPRASTRRCPARTTRPRPRSSCCAALGADLVGMSTVLEAIAARHLGAEVLGISLVTNLAAGLAPGGLDHAGGHRRRPAPPRSGSARCWPESCRGSAEMIPADLRARAGRLDRRRPGRAGPGRVARAAGR